MRVVNFLGRLVGAFFILMLCFAAGSLWHNFRVVHDGASLRYALRLAPAQVENALLTAAHGQTDEYSPDEVYADVLTTLRANYYNSDDPDKKIDPTQMTYNGIRGMMASVKDRYTRFMDPTAYGDMKDENNGVFGGIGAMLGTNKKNQVYIVHDLPSGPAIKAKVMNGDIILSVNGKKTVNLKDTDVVDLIRGPIGTKVTLVLLRKGVTAPISITLTRAQVTQEVVQSGMLDPTNKIGYIHLTQFNQESDIQIDRALTTLQKQGMRGLVFDLRDNPGGLLDIAQQVASRFIPSGPIVWIKDRSETSSTMEHLDVEPSQHNHPRYPMVVLVNGDSASAAEIVSGAIKDTQTGILVGDKTFGKGLVQTIIPLDDGSAVAITTQHYFTARKNDINHKGIIPNVPVALSDDDQRKMFAFLEENPTAIYDLKFDRQLQTAVTHLKQAMPIASAQH